MTNTTPVAEDVTGSSYEDQSVPITLVSSGTGDGSSVPPSFTFSTAPAHGTLWIVPPIPFVEPGLAATPGQPILADTYDPDTGVWSTALTFLPAPNWGGTTT